MKQKVYDRKTKRWRDRRGHFTTEPRRATRKKPVSATIPRFYRPPVTGITWPVVVAPPPKKRRERRPPEAVVEAPPPRKRRPPRPRTPRAEILDRFDRVSDNSIGHSMVAQTPPDFVGSTFEKVVTAYAAKGPKELDDVLFHSVGVGFRVVGRIEGSAALDEILTFLGNHAPSLGVQVVRASDYTQNLHLTYKHTGDFDDVKRFAGGVLRRAAEYAWEVLDAYFDDAGWWVEWESDEDIY